MNTSKKTLLLALFTAFGLTAAACGGSTATTATDSTEDAEATDTTEATDTSEAMDEGDHDDDAMDEDSMSGDDMGDDSMIGSGQEVTMARADWASGYVQAELYRQVLTELGYEVSDPSDLELAPSLAYQQMAEGNIDFWTNSWYPGHLSWWEPELTDGSIIGDHLVKVEGLFQDSGVQGFLITKAWADEFNITTMDQINDSEEIRSMLPDSDGDGVHEIYGCQESWTCDDIIESQIAFAGWDNIQQIKAGYDVMFAEFLDTALAGEPAIIYTWTPAAYVTQAIPGQDVYWLSMETASVLDDSNPLGVEGGELYAQTASFTGFDADLCTQGPDGCNLGWEAADIQVTANADWADDNPNLIAMFETMRPSIVDISIAQVEQTNGDGTQADVVRIVTDYIAANRDLVDQWKAVAIG